MPLLQDTIFNEVAVGASLGHSLEHAMCAVHSITDCLLVSVHPPFFQTTPGSGRRLTRVAHLASASLSWWSWVCGMKLGLLWLQEPHCSPCCLHPWSFISWSTLNLEFCFIPLSLHVLLFWLRNHMRGKNLFRGSWQPSKITVSSFIIWTGGPWIYKPLECFLNSTNTRAH